MGCGASTDDDRRSDETDRRESERPVPDTESAKKRECEQVEEIRKKRPKQNILSTNSESMTHYKTSTFYIDDDDHYYESKDVKVQGELHRKGSVLKKRESSATEDELAASGSGFGPMVGEQSSPTFLAAEDSPKAMSGSRRKISFSDQAKKK